MALTDVKVRTAKDINSLMMKECTFTFILMALSTGVYPEISLVDAR